MQCWSQQPTELSLPLSWPQRWLMQANTITARLLPLLPLVTYWHWLQHSEERSLNLNLLGNTAQLTLMAWNWWAGPWVEVWDNCSYKLSPVNGFDKGKLTLNHILCHLWKIRELSLGTWKSESGPCPSHAATLWESRPFSFLGQK